MQADNTGEEVKIISDEPVIIKRKSPGAAISIFSKLTFICNLCFIASVILRWFEMSNKQKGNFDGILKLQPLESTIVILGYFVAIILNLVFNCIVLVWLVRKIQAPLPKWLIWFNFLILVAQIYYFFF